MKFELEKDREGSKRYPFKVRVLDGDFVEQDSMAKLHCWAVERFNNKYIPCYLQGSTWYQHAFRFTKEHDAAMFVMRWQYADLK